MDISNHKCECTQPGLCKKFGQYMDDRHFDMCQTALLSALRMQVIGSLYSKIVVGRCVHKGLPLVDEYGFRKTRYQGCGCAGEPVSKTTLYQCSAPGAYREGEDNCELRCTSFIPAPHNTTDQN
jgi:hypothetical protein